MENVENSLATELLQELKRSAMRWFIIAMAELVAIVVLLILLFCTPTSTTEEVQYDQSIEDIQSSGVTQIIGDSYGKSEADGN